MWRHDIRKYSLCSSVVNIWNSLPDCVVESDSVNSFTSRLDKHWADQDVLSLTWNHRRSFWEPPPETLDHGQFFFQNGISCFGFVLILFKLHEICKLIVRKIINHSSINQTD